MRCPNNSFCIFNGVGTFEGIINGRFIKLENVYYSKHINKNLLGGIRLAKSEYVWEIFNQNGETTLYLRFGFNKKENKNLVEKFITDEFNIKRIPIKLVNRQNDDTIYANNDKHREYIKKNLASKVRSLLPLRFS